MKSKRQETVAASLLLYLASGGTLECVMRELSEFGTRLQAVLDWMQSNARCAATDVQRRAEHLGDVIRRKHAAVMRSDFDEAADLRAEECSLLESMGLQASTGEAWHTVLRVRTEDQIQQLSRLLHEDTTQ